MHPPILAGVRRTRTVPYSDRAPPTVYEDNVSGAPRNQGVDGSESEATGAGSSGEHAFKGERMTSTADV